MLPWPSGPRLRVASLPRSLSALVSAESYTASYPMISWVTGGIVVVHMTVYSVSMPVANERHFGHHGGGRFVLLLILAKHAALQRYFWRKRCQNQT